MRFFAPLLLLISLCTGVRAQTSLFDKAVALDSLYTKVLNGQTDVAKDIFGELRGLYPGGENLTDEALYEDINEVNVYLLPKLNYVYSLVEDTRVEEDNREAELNAERDSILARLERTADAYCPDYDCDWHADLTLMIFVDEAQEIRRVRKTLGPELDELAEKLRAIERELMAVDIQIDRLKQENAALIRDGDDVGLGLPVGGGNTVDQGFAPIVVQASGGSVQGAVIDGASRWIAERMREELSIAFFDRFEVWLEEKQMASLFPNTVGAFNITATTDYSLMIQVLRTAFENDLEELPFNIGPFLRRELAEQGDAEYIQYEADEAYRAYRTAVLDFHDDPKRTGMASFDEDIKAKNRAMNDQLERLANTNKGLNYVLFAIAAMQELSDGNHPANLLSILNARSDELFPQGGDIRPALMLADVVIRSFIRLDPQKGTTWVSRKELTRLSRDQQLREFYYGLVYHEIHRNFRARRNQLQAAHRKISGKLGYLDNYDLGNKLNRAQRGQMRELLQNDKLVRIEQQLYLLESDEFWMDFRFEYSPEEVGTLLNELSLFTERLDGLSQQYSALLDAGQAGIGNTKLVQLIRHSLNVIKPVLNAALDNAAQIDRIERLSLGILDAYTGVLERDYEAVILNVIPVANTLLDVDFAEALEANKGESKALIEYMTNEHGARKRKLQEVFRYGAFLAAVAESRSPEDIKQAIRAIALPTGSYSIKRRSFANISLNAYPGLTGGYELIQNGLGQRWAPNFGFTAPIGLAFSWGYRGKINNKRYLSNPKYRRRVDRSLDMREDRFLTGHSGSVFFSLLDLGAVVLFRLSDEESSLPEDVGFQQLFSPGVMYSHGFSNLPISIMAGMQVSPQLRKFGDAPADSFRFNLGVTVDLPMANFYTRSVEKE